MTQHLWPGMEPSDPTAPAFPGARRSGDPWIVVLLDPQTGELESYGPYSQEQATRLQSWCAAELDLADLGDVVVMVAPMQP